MQQYFPFGGKIRLTKRNIQKRRDIENPDFIRGKWRSCKGAATCVSKRAERLKKDSRRDDVVLTFIHKMKKFISNPIVLIALQIVGLATCIYLKRYDITPMSDLMRLPAGRWDLTADLIAVVLIAAPAFYAYEHKMKGWRWVVGMFFLPFVLIAVGVLYLYGLGKYHDYQKMQERKQTYGNAEKVEQVVGIGIPDFKVVNYKEKRVEDDAYRALVCSSDIQWKEPPSRQFYLSLDSLCQTEGSHWKKSGDVYLFDSMAVSDNVLQLVLSLIITKDKPRAQLSFDIPTYQPIRMLLQHS